MIIYNKREANIFFSGLHKDKLICMRKDHKFGKEANTYEEAVKIFDLFGVEE